MLARMRRLTRKWRRCARRLCDGVRATADEHGVVYLPAVATGLTQIVASYPGFSPTLEKATLKTGDNTETVKLRLAPVVEKVTVKPADSTDRSS